MLKRPNDGDFGNSTRLWHTHICNYQLAQNSTAMMQSIQIQHIISSTQRGVFLSVLLRFVDIFIIATHHSFFRCCCQMFIEEETLAGYSA